MGLVATREKRDKLRLLWAAALEANRDQPSLLDQLNAALKIAEEAMQNGRFVSSTSGAGRHVAFAAVSGMTPLDAKRLSGELLDLYDKAAAYLISVNQEAPSEAAIYSQMLNGTTGPRLVRVGAFRSDFTNIRIGTLGTSIVQ